MGGPFFVGTAFFKPQQARTALLDPRNSAPWLVALLILLSPDGWARAGSNGSSDLQDQGIVIGLVAPASGLYQRYGAQMRAGFDQAVRDINAAGGVLGQALRPVIADDACDTTRAVAAARQMAAMGARIVVGHFCSGASIAAARTYAADNIVQISPAARHPDFTDKRAGPSIFRLAGREDEQGRIAGQFMAGRFTGKKIALLHDRTAYGMGLVHGAKLAMNRAGVKEIFLAAFKAGEKDYGALVKRLSAVGADVVYLGSHANEAGIIVRQMRESGLAALVVAGDAIATPEFWQLTAPFGEGTFMTFMPDARKQPGAAPVMARLHANGTEPEGVILATYAAVEMWAKAAVAAQSTQAEAVAAELSSRTFSTALGDVAFDHKGDTTRPAYSIHVWKGAGGYEQID